MSLILSFPCSVERTKEEHHQSRQGWTAGRQQQALPTTGILMITSFQRNSQTQGNFQTKLTSSEMHLPLSSSPHVLYDSVESLLPRVVILSALGAKQDGGELVLGKKNVSQALRQCLGTC